MKNSVSIIFAIATLFIATFACTSPPEQTEKKPPILNPSTSFSFDEWTYDSLGWFWTRGEEPWVFSATEKDISDDGTQYSENPDQFGRIRYYDTPSSFYVTLNNIFALSGSGGISPGPLTTFRDAGYNSPHSAKLVSRFFRLGVKPIFIPGAVGSILVDILAIGDGGNMAIFGKPYKDFDDIITGYYKYSPVANDSAAIWVDVWKWNETTQRRDTLGSTRIKIGSKTNFQYPATSVWTQFEAPITYRQGKYGIQPDSINVIFASSAGFNFNDLFDCEGQERSTLWIDEVIIGKKQE